MRILITGVTGRVGSRVAPYVHAHGHTVRALVRDRTSSAARALQAAGIELVEGDLTQPETLAQALADVDAVVHLAATFRGATEAQMQVANLDGTLALAHAALEAHIQPFVYISTSLVYGPGRGRPAREDDVPQPLPGQIYPITKLAAEQALQALNHTGALGLCILRLSFVYGDGDPHLAEAVRWASVWPAQQRLQMVHHVDVAQAVLLAVEKPKARGQIYNVADLAPVTASEILRLNGLAVAEDAHTRPLPDPWEGVLDVSRIRRDLGWNPLYPSVADAERAGAL